MESKGGTGTDEGIDSPVNLIRMVAMNVDRLVIRPEDEDIVDEIRNLLQVQLISSFFGRCISFKRIWRVIF